MFINALSALEAEAMQAEERNRKRRSSENCERKSKRRSEIQDEIVDDLSQASPESQGEDRLKGTGPEETVFYNKGVKIMDTCTPEGIYKNIIFVFDDEFSVLNSYFTENTNHAIYIKE